jgi:hypothetical protein
MGQVLTMNRPLEMPVCSECGTAASPRCNCGATFISKTELASRALAANPGKSNVMVAEAIGVSESTVRAARSETQPRRNNEVEERVGKDGKTRKMPNRKPESDKPTKAGTRKSKPTDESIEDGFDTKAADANPENYQIAFMLRIDQALQFSRDADFLTKGMVKVSKSKKQTHKEIAERASAVASAWTALAQKHKE